MVKVVDDENIPFYPHEKGVYVQRPTIIDGFWLDSARVKVEGTDKFPTQNLALVKHLKSGVDCYVALGIEEKKTDQELADMGKDVLRKLATEARQFDSMNMTDQLTDVHKCIGKYVSAFDSESLAILRQEFKQLASQFPQISENLNQIDFAATWDWQIKQNVRKPIEFLFDVKPIDGLSIKDDGFTPIIMSPTPEHKPDR